MGVREACLDRGLAQGVTGASCGDSDEEPGCHYSRPGAFRGFRLRTAPVMCMCVCVYTCLCVHTCVCMYTCVRACMCVCTCGTPLPRQAPSKHLWDQTVIELPKDRKGLCHGLGPWLGWAQHPFLTGTPGAPTPTQAPLSSGRSLVARPGVPAPLCILLLSLPDCAAGVGEGRGWQHQQPAVRVRGR